MTLLRLTSAAVSMPNERSAAFGAGPTPEIVALSMKQVSRNRCFCRSWAISRPRWREGVPGRASFGLRHPLADRGLYIVGPDTAIRKRRVQSGCARARLRMAVGPCVVGGVSGRASAGIGSASGLEAERRRARRRFWSRDGHCDSTKVQRLCPVCSETEGDAWRAGSTSSHRAQCTGRQCSSKTETEGGGDSYSKNWIGATSNGRNGGTTAAQRTSRFELERRIRAAVKVGYERHPTLGTIPAQTLLAAEAWRLRPRAALRSPDN